MARRALGARWRTANIALEQRLGQHAGLELGYDRQKYEDRFVYLCLQSLR